MDPKTKEAYITKDKRFGGIEMYYTEDNMKNRNYIYREANRHLVTAIKSEQN